MSFVFVRWLEADYQLTSGSNKVNQEGRVSSAVHRTLNRYRFCKTKNEEMCTCFVWELWGKWPGCCSLTPSAVTSFSVTNRRLPAKLFLNRWICFLQQGAALFFCAEQSKIPLLFVTSALCRILPTPGLGYFSGRQIAIPVALFSAGCTTNNLCLCIHTHTHLILKVKPHLGTVCLPLLLLRLSFAQENILIFLQAIHCMAVLSQMPKVCFLV